MTGNPVPEAKWVLRGRIVTNNTSPLYGNNDNIQYVIHERGNLFSVIPLPMCRMRAIHVLGGFERWFNLTVVNISEDDADDYTCVGVNAGRRNNNISTVQLHLSFPSWNVLLERNRKCFLQFIYNL